MFEKASRRGFIARAIAALIVLGPAATCGPAGRAPPPRLVLKGHRGPVHGIVPSTDGRLLVSTGEKDGTVRIWDLASGAQRRLIKQELVGTTMKIWDIVSPSERRLILARSVKPRALHGGALNLEAALLPDDRQLFLSVAAGGQSSVYPDDLIVYDLASGGCRTICSEGDLYRTALDPSGHVLGYGEMGWRPEDGADRHTSEIHLFGIPKRRILATIDADGLSFYRFALLRGGEMIATIASSNVFTKRKNMSGEVIVWDARTGKKRGRVRTDGRTVYQTEFSPDGQELAMIGGYYGSTVFICYLGSYKITHTLNELRDKPGQARMYINYLEYTSDGKHLAAGAADGTILFWETKNYRDVLWARLYPSGVVHAVFSPDGKTMVATSGGKSEEEEIRVWDLDRILSLIPGAAGTPRR